MKLSPERLKEFMFKPSLAIVVDWYWPLLGGVEKTVQTLANGLNSQFDITIITHRLATNKSLFTNYTSSRKQPQTDTDGNRIKLLTPSLATRLILIPLLLWNLPGIKRTARLFDFFYRFYEIAYFRQLKNLIGTSDIVHCFSTGYLARCVTSICNKNEIPLVHTPYIHFGKWGDSPEQIAAYCRANIVLCPTTYFFERFIAQIKNKYQPEIRVIVPLIPDPVNPDLIHSPIDGNFILFLGRREAHKGLAMLLDAYKGLERLAKLVIAGPGVKVTTGCESIIDMGEIDENTKQYLLSNCALLCVPSTDETFGLVYAEAMSYGKTVVALDISPVNEIVENGKTGILVSPDDSDGLQTALDKALNDDSMLKEMGQRGYVRYKDFYSSNRIIEEHKSIYRDLLRP